MEPPDWAVEHARAALNIGMKAPEIEQRLVAKGLSPEEANDVVMGILEGRVRSEAPPVGPEEAGLPLHQILSLLHAGIFVAVSYWLGGAIPSAYTLICILPGLAGIWLPSMMTWDWQVSPASCRVFGWIWLYLFGFGRVILIAIYN